MKAVFVGQIQSGSQVFAQVEHKVAGQSVHAGPRKSFPQVLHVHGATRSFGCGFLSSFLMSSVLSAMMLSPWLLVDSFLHVPSSMSSTFCVAD